VAANLVEFISTRQRGNSLLSMISLFQLTFNGTGITLALNAVNLIIP